MCWLVVLDEVVEHLHLDELVVAQLPIAITVNTSQDLASLGLGDLVSHVLQCVSQLIHRNVTTGVAITYCEALS